MEILDHHAALLLVMPELKCAAKNTVIANASGVKQPG